MALRASLIALSALATSDLMALDEAEAAFRCELATIDRDALAARVRLWQHKLADSAHRP